jgi:hypothetical protein
MRSTIKLENPDTGISVGNANFTLSTSELGGIKPVKGGHLSFTVQELSLWDEAI